MMTRDVVILLVLPFVVGYIAGVTTSPLWRRRPPRRDKPGTPAPRRRRWPWRDIGSTAFGLIVLATFVTAAVQQQRQTSCYQDYFAKVSENLSARTADTNATADAQIVLLEAPAKDFPRARDAYIDALRRQAVTRAASPIPPPPDCR